MSFLDKKEEKLQNNASRFKDLILKIKEIMTKNKCLNIKLTAYEREFERLNDEVQARKNEAAFHYKTVNIQKEYIEQLEKENRKLKSSIQIDPDACMPQNY